MKEVFLVKGYGTYADTGIFLQEFNSYDDAKIFIENHGGIYSFYSIDKLFRTL